MRDLRDPEKIGEALLGLRIASYTGAGVPTGMSLSQCYDFWKNNLRNVDDYPKDFTHDFPGQYKQELEEREDKYAKERLQELGEDKAASRVKSSATRPPP